MKYDCKNIRHLEDGETKSSTTNADNVVVDSSNNELELLCRVCGVIITIAVTLVLEVTIGGSNSLLRWADSEANVGKLSEVGRSHWVKVHEIKRV